MNLHIQQMPDSNCKLIPVASELIPEGEKVETITHEGKVFEVVDRFIFEKGDFIPKGFLKIVRGKEIDINEIWKKYNKSNDLIVYVCFPLAKEAAKIEAKESEKEAEIPKILD